MKPIALGILSSFFFAFTFVLNRAMELSGGSWIWSSSLRYFFMVPFLLAIVLWRKNFQALIFEMKRHPWKWILWSTIGFGLFYAPITFAAAYGPGWLIAGTWQITIISGSLLVPLFYETIQTKNGPLKKKAKIPLKGLGMSSIILIGVILMQWEHFGSLSLKEAFIGTSPVFISTFAYPLGNRKMMEICEGRIDVYQRVLGMTMASLPFWIVLAILGLVTVGGPSSGQTFQSLLVTISSGVIATVLFFQATDLVKDNMKKLAAVEATQSIEILFALAGEIVLLHSDLPATIALVGILFVIMGMVFHSYLSHGKKKDDFSLTEKQELSS
ncbi:multidrug resistance efflux transporter family protein [Cytobacillus sp. Hz8]|uniref:DMT family transporter n=1 Tax=Cytobacillus sp. Hz8 TaxID=3347168 RepID=UPI0035DB9D7B